MFSVSKYLAEPEDNPRLDPRVNDLPYKEPGFSHPRRLVDSCSAWIMLFTFDPTDDNAFLSERCRWPGNSRASFLRCHREKKSTMEHCFPVYKQLAPFPQDKFL